MSGCFRNRGTHYCTLILGCLLWFGCASSTTSQPKKLSTASVPGSTSAKPTQQYEIDSEVELNSQFLAKIEQIPDDFAKRYYMHGIHELSRQAQRDPANQAILKKLITHQEKTLQIFQACGHSASSGDIIFDWQAIPYAQFWERADSSYLILLICNSSRNRSIVPAIFSEAKGEAQLKMLKLTQFRQGEDGEIYQVESHKGIGRPFPDEPYEWFNPETQELKLWLQMAGGTNPCGTRATYRLQHDEFVLQKFTALFDCDRLGATMDDHEQIYP
ncbi:MAG: hypothetical protein ACFBSF_12065 [Leptolyngbyaceae cyanobacterium]